MNKIIAIVNQKGGVGKTTTCINLAASFVVLAQQTLLIDLDPQGNATTGSGLNPYETEVHITDVLLGKTPVRESIYRSVAGYGLIPSHADLTVAEIELLKKERREYCLSEHLAGLRDSYEYILIDCPPSLNMLTVNALVAADSVLIPMQCEYFALEGLTSLIDTIQTLKAAANTRLEIEGLLRTLFDTRNSLSRQVSEELLKHFKDKVYDTIIPRNVRLAEAPSYGQPVLLYDPNSTGSQAYLNLAKEILRKQGVLQEPQTASSFVGLLKRQVEPL